MHTDKTFILGSGSLTERERILLRNLRTALPGINVSFRRCKHSGEYYLLLPVSYKRLVKKSVQQLKVNNPPKVRLVKPIEDRGSIKEYVKVTCVEAYLLMEFVRELQKLTQR